MFGLVHTAGTEERLPMGVDLNEVEAEAKKFGVHVAMNMNTDYSKSKNRA